ncbi:MAG: muconate cycloisomerase [Planctomycetaceae bacterium]|nr:muconate cycloisomerase [Planctomycetaceae bacterium]
MQIASVEAIPVRIPLKPERRMVSALGKHEVSEFVLVKLMTNDGLVGAGEATVTPQWSGETVWGAKSIIERLFAPLVTGCDPHDIDDLSTRMEKAAVGNWFARAAIEMACWDVVGQQAGKPIYELLGGACRPLTIRNRFSLGAYPPDVAGERAAALAEAGFETIKVKVATDPKLDVQRVQAVREAIGPERTLTVDANAGWRTVEQAMATLDRMADCHIALVEQPLLRNDFHGLKELRDVTGHKILADESCFDEMQLRELILHDCCDAITLYPGKQGGIARAHRMAALAGEAGIPCTIGSNLEWDVGAAGMMQFIVSSPNVQIETIPGDCLGPSYHEFAIVKNPLVIEGPFTTLPDTPGLGIEVDWDLVEQHRIDR